MYIDPGQGQTTPLGQNFDVNRNSLSQCPFVASQKKNLFEVDFLAFLCFFHMYIAPDRDRQPIGDKTFCDNRKAFFLCPYVASFKMISWKSDFIHIFNGFIYVYSASLLQVSNKSLWILILYTIFNVLPHVYSPGAGPDNPLWTKSWCQQKSLATLPICCKFQKNIFEVWFYT